MIIYFRACEKQDTISYVTRFNNFNKTIILKKCWLSIQKSIKNSDTLLLIEDNLSKETLEWLLKNSSIPFEIISVPEHTWEHHQHTVTLVETLKKYCEKYPEELHYIVEDDYLHVENALEVLYSTLRDWNAFAVPYDYPDRYANPELCSVMIGLDRHWRTVNSSTMTVLTKGKTWLSVIKLLEQAAPTSNDKVFEEIYKQIPCINPLPGLACHLTDRHPTPLINWNAVWDSINVE